jgi:hypothetical protein
MTFATTVAALQISAAALFTAGVLCAQDLSGTDGERVHARTKSEGRESPGIVPHRLRPQVTESAAAGANGLIYPPITYHGGSVMRTPNVYLIWYGNWNRTNNSDTPGGQAIIRDFLHGLSGSNYYMTNASYGGPSGMFAVVKETTDRYSQGYQLSDRGVQNVVAHAFASGALPKDTNGIYFVLTSSDIPETSGFCNQYCGWHTDAIISGLDIKFAFVGNAYRCLDACAEQTVGPNQNAGVDGMVSLIAHELEEANTDPDLDAWYDYNGDESADKCAWTFGSNVRTDRNGAYYNMTLIGRAGNSRNFLVQRELDVNNKCYVDYVNRIQ